MWVRFSCIPRVSWVQASPFGISISPWRNRRRNRWTSDVIQCDVICCKILFISLSFATRRDIVTFPRPDSNHLKKMKNIFLIGHFKSMGQCFSSIPVFQIKRSFDPSFFIFSFFFLKNWRLQTRVRVFNMTN